MPENSKPQMPNLAEMVAELQGNNWHQLGKPVEIISPSRVVYYATMYALIETEETSITLYKVPGVDAVFLYKDKRQTMYNDGKFDPRKFLEPEEKDCYISLDQGSLILSVWQCIDLPQEIA